MIKKDIPVLCNMCMFNREFIKGVYRRFSKKELLEMLGLNENLSDVLNHILSMASLAKLLNTEEFQDVEIIAHLERNGEHHFAIEVIGEHESEESGEMLPIFYTLTYSDGRCYSENFAFEDKYISEDQKYETFKDVYEYLSEHTRIDTLYQHFQSIGLYD